MEDDKCNDFFLLVAVFFVIVALMALTSELAG